MAGTRGQSARGLAQASGPRPLWAFRLVSLFLPGIVVLSVETAPGANAPCHPPLALPCACPAYLSTRFAPRRN